MIESVRFKRKAFTGKSCMCFAISMLALSAAPLSAGLITYQLVGVETSDGDAVTGSFTIDTVTSALTGINIVSAADPQAGVAAVTFNACDFCQAGLENPGVSYFTDADPTNRYNITMFFLGALTSSGSIPIDFAYGDQNGVLDTYIPPGGTSKYTTLVTGGLDGTIVSTVPEPTSVTLLLGALILIGGERFRHCRRIPRSG